MVGGIVIGIAETGDEALVHVKDAKSANSSGNECSVRCRLIDKNGYRVFIKVGDALWWQGGNCYWTPKPGLANGRCGVDFDIALPKIGYSH